MDSGPRCSALALMRGRVMKVRCSANGPRRQSLALGTGIAGALLLSALWACSSATLRSAGGFRDQNRSNIERLVIGMPRDQVVSIMGTAALPRPLGTEGSGQVRTERDSLGVTRVQVLTRSSAPALYNPMRTGTYEAGGHAWEVLFYYVRLIEDDGVVSDDELEPVVLRDGRLAGVGWSYWEETADREGIPIGRDASEP